MSAAIEIQDVTKRFGGLTAIRDLTFSVDDGLIYGIIGPNGAGKSTLFNLLTGFIRPDSGTISIRGQRVNGRSPHAVTRLGVGRTFQIPELFRRLTVFDTLVTASLHRRSLEESRAEAARILDILHMEDRRDAFPAELTVAGQKRLEIGRALATGADIVLLDESLAGLTEAETESMVELIRELQSSGHTIVIVEHVMRVIMRLCDRILVLNFGERIAEGAPDEISRDPKVIEAYLGSE